MNRRVTVRIEQRNIDVDSNEPWMIEESFEYDPSKLRVDDALDTLPKIDHTIRLLRVTSDYLQEWLKPRLKERAIGEKI